MNIFGYNFLDKYKYIQVYQKWVNMNRNTIIGTNTNKHKCQYENYRKFFFIDIKVIKLWQLMQICAMKTNLWCLVYNNKNTKCMITNTNKLGLTKKGEY